MGSNNAPADSAGFNESLTQSLYSGVGSCATKLPLTVPEVPMAIPEEMANPHLD